MNVKVSIIIPVYNVAPYLDACLSSCIHQTFQDIEIIVVNDGSPDMSYQIIAAYAAINERIVVINKENEGLIYARKSGLDIARGEYIFFLDGDDYIADNTIEELYKVAVKDGADYVIADFLNHTDNYKEEERFGKEVIGLSGQDFLFFLFDRPAWSICGRLIRKDLFDGIIYRSVFMGEDIYLNMQIALNVKNAAAVDKCLYNCVRHEGSVTVRKDEKICGLYLEMIESIWSLLDIYPYEQRIKESIYDFFLFFFTKSIRDDRREVRRVLKYYFWDKKEVRAYLWKRRKKNYIQCAGYLYAPWITSFGTKLRYKLNIYYHYSQGDSLKK